MTDRLTNKLKKHIAEVLQNISVVFHDIPRPCTACRSTSFLTRSTLLSQHIMMQRFTNSTKYRM